MLDFLEKLREKPEATRKKIVFISAAMITGIIFLVWLSVVTVRLTDISSTDIIDTKKFITEEELPAFDDVQKDLLRFLEEGREIFEDIESLSSDSAEDTEASEIIDVSTNPENGGIEIIEVENTE